MTVRQHRTKWMVDIAIRGERIREYGFKNRALAKAREKELVNSQGKVPKQQTLLQFVDRWQELHGHTLKDKYRYSRTKAIADRIGGYVKDFNAAKFAEYRIERLNEVSVSTVNHETRYFRSLFNEMIRLDHYFSENPISKIKTFKENQKELGFLDENQIKELLSLLSASRHPHVLIIAEICLATGARWGEVESLRRTDVIINDSSCMVRFVGTKNGNVRHVQVDRSFALNILESGQQSVRLFKTARYAFRSVVEKSGFVMPSQQLTHILRHSFASHYMMNGGDILDLKNIMGHSDLKQTERYAHLSPSHLAKVVDLNPLSKLGIY